MIRSDLGNRLISEVQHDSSACSALLPILQLYILPLDSMSGLYTELSCQTVCSPIDQHLRSEQ